MTLEHEWEALYAKHPGKTTDEIISLESKGEKFVNVRAEEMPPIPPGSNPFNHDFWSMGTDLVRGWIVMHDGFDNKDEPMPLRRMYLVNTRTGQRIRLHMEEI